ncbi:DUF6850 family outer membrane beta-barrel protein [Myroides sp. DW712]|uniref:DUF6850 family outer membrane beta-barrel protein n=1 Tax=Myroides sp. DW712 TaxID=3389800 RepID=UPI00397DF266
MMKLTQKIGVFLFLYSLSVGLVAQEFSLVPLSTLQVLDSTAQRMNLGEQPNYVWNPAYLNKEKIHTSQTQITTFYQDFKEKKSYNILKGKEFSAYGLQAHWFTPIDTTANFLGQVRFAKGNQEDVYANTMRLSEAYGPYLLLHKKTSDFSFQHYDVRGTYSKKIAAMTWGLHLYYTGDYAYKQTDPRAKAIGSWFGVQLGGIYAVSPQHEIGISSTYEIHSQHVELDVWKGNIKQQFLLLRGFGMYDHDHKDQVFSKKRVYKQQQVDVNLMASFWKKSPLTLEVFLDGLVRKMKTEEETTINLYQLTTTVLQPQIRLHYTFTPAWQTQIKLSHMQQRLTGQENRYSYQRVNEDYSGVYDYVKIGALKPYTLEDDAWKVGWKWSYTVNQQWNYQFGIQYTQTTVDERYQGTTFRTRLEKNKPGLGLNLNYNKHKHQVCLGFQVESEKSSKADAQKDSSYESLYDEVYYPMFVYQSMDKTTWSMALNYSYQLKENQRLGVKVGFSKIEGNKTKLKDVEAFAVEARQFSIQGYYQF